MSRIGKQPIQIPDKVTITVENGVVRVSGPLGELTFEIPEGITVQVDTENKQVIVERASDKRNHKMLHGTTRAIINNMVTGVTQGFTRELEIHGVGYKVEMEGQKLKLSLGLNTPIYVEIPEGLKVELPSQTEIKITGIDKAKVGNFAGYLRNLKRPDPYKGKGIRYKGEQIKLKEVKTLGA